MSTTPLPRKWAVAALVLVAGCAAPPPAFVDLMTPIPGNGDLTSSIESMKAGELWEQADRLQFVLGPQQERRCADGYCEARVDAVANQDPGPGNVSTNGTVVARLVNRGKWGGWNNQGAENRYGIRFLRGTDEVYYLIAIRTDAGWRWSLRLARRGDYTNVAQEIQRGGWQDCTRDLRMEGHPKGKSAFASCPHTPNGQTQMQLVYSRDDPAWLDCEMGCCVAAR